MKIAVLKERTEGESRVAITPDAIKRYTKLSANVMVEAGAGSEAGISDEAYSKAGAEVVADAGKVLEAADIVLAVRPPQSDILSHLPEGAILVGMLEPHQATTQLPDYQKRALTTFSLELLPRISRAQSMDVLSSQSNLSGYRAVIDGVHALSKAVPMMMTAAGTVAPAKVLVLGAGVAGLQAIATAKRLGAVVHASDVRPAVKEQVESLGGKFIDVPVEGSDGETSGGYAKEMSEDYKRKQGELVFEAAKKSDIVITTALIPGRPAPMLVPATTVNAMKQGSVIVDLAVAFGGNCELSKPGETVVENGVTILGHTNLPGRVAIDASHLYARNLVNFITTLLLSPEGALAPQWDDELIAGTLLTREGNPTHPSVTS